ncbi:hypothetical protein CLUG_05793 [Clavispora lusitaniae ATCC 42720]|uniref:Activator of Hsp90 ATPase AHSA1-like N-terminal domain-containing protein n=1 Tax=Clavispora lusitaniae (strain ATCC 42720) TaxID=306902 RepID=C4YCF4_CLAL4|nr:uncharacterized protein CLUG_05793 [Clavispora lusitaniae ATCC 42720]EEQ41665.1 hypothetical protein CLUG_05793 [Clavispora lusitaniae ATCC 42720]
MFSSLNSSTLQTSCGIFWKHTSLQPRIPIYLASTHFYSLSKMVVNNPNNWHWVDKNCMEWAKKYLAEKVGGLSAEENGAQVAVSSVSSVEGDVEVCQRKGKMISLFDLRIVVDLSGSGADGSVKGSITIPELAYDTEKDEIQFDVSVYETSGDDVRLLAKRKLVPQLRDVLSHFGADLIAAHASDIQMESDRVNSVLTKQNQEGVKAKTEAKTQAQKKEAPQTKTETKAAKTEETPSGVPRYNTSTLHLEPTFNTTAEQLYITLLDPQRVAAWSRSSPQMEAFPPSEGSEFRLFGGSIRGRFTRLVANERITQDWRLEDWKQGHYAQLDIQLKQGAGETTMVVKWSGIPIGEEDRVRGNFEEYYVRSIKIVFGFGAVL